MSDTILVDQKLESKSLEDDENENVNENDKTLKSSDKDDDYGNENKNENEIEGDDETIKYLNNLLDEIIGKSKSFEKQIK